MSKYIVTTYKVNQALAAGHPKDSRVLEAVTGRPRYEIDQTLIDLFPNEFKTPELDVPIRTTATLDELIDYARYIVECRGIQALVEYEYYPSPCGCMGPQDNEPLCPCGMRAALHDNKVAVINHFDPTAALKVMRPKIVKALA